MSKATALHQLLDRARRRRLFHLVFEQAALALAIGFGGVLLLLVLGTQILDWYWPVILFAASFGVGLYRLFRGMPSVYELAQRIDRALGLHDSLSTALHFEARSDGADPDVIRIQRDAAERDAAAADPVRALPFAMPRSAYVAVAAAAVVLGMFALRYGVTRTLDLKASLVQAAIDSLWPESPQEARRKKQDKKPNFRETAMNTSDSTASPMDPAPDNTLNSIEVPNSQSPSESGSDTAKSKAEGPPSERPGNPNEGSGEKSERSSPGDQNANDSTPDNGQSPNSPNPDGKAAANAKQSPPKSGENSSLMDKMKDAMSNLLNKLKMQPKQGEGQQQQQAQSGQSGQQQKSGQKGQQSPGKPDANGAEGQDQQGDQQAESGEKAQGAQGKQGQQSAERAAAQDAKSGIGKQDGNKDARDAEQLQAMGKISEIFGKRSKEVTGQVMLEVGGGRQQLKTQYSQVKGGEHTEPGAEIHRDEVPLLYQQYVQQYFEEIRKQPGPSAAPSSRKKTDAAKPASE